MENNDKTLKELAMADVFYQPCCIQYPQLEPAQSYELKSGLIHLLPKFHGIIGEDPHKHLKEFHVSVMFNIWGDMKRMFLEKFFSASRIATIRKEIYGIYKHSGETLHEFADDGPEHSGCSEWGSPDGQNPSGNKASNLKHGKQRAILEIEKLVDGAHIFSEAARCRPTSTSCTSMWDLRLGGAPY
ncbi:hypothetical protein CR513_26956, partial [Mucuna pruriens]